MNTFEIRAEHFTDGPRWTIVDPHGEILGCRIYLGDALVFALSLDARSIRVVSAEHRYLLLRQEVPIE